MELCISACCVFAPWLHWGSFISPWTLSRQTSYSAFVCALPSCHFRGSKEKVAVKATPLPSLQPHRSILKRGQMTHEPRVLLSLASASSLSFSIAPSRTFTSTVVCFEGRKTTLRLWNSKRLTLWCVKKPPKKRIEKHLCLLSKKCHVFTCTSQTEENVSNDSCSVSLPCVPFWILVVKMSQPQLINSDKYNTLRGNCRTLSRSNLVWKAATF